MAHPLASGFDPALGRRTASALILAAATLAAVAVGGWLFVLLILAAIGVMAVEWSRLTVAPAGSARTAAALAVAVVAAAASVALAAGSATLAWGIMLLGTLLAAGLGAFLPAVRPGHLALGALYLGLPALAVIWLRNAAAGGLAHVVWLLLVVWTTDIGAYFAGRSIGGPKLAPRISPGKTWAGLAGGMAAAGLVGGLMTALVGAGFWFAAGLGALLAAVAQAGDLFESRLKRHAGVKDSGRLIPGHGGLLDRIDGLVFAAPAFALMVALMAAAP